jgi:hypothetical protein
MKTLLISIVLLISLRLNSQTNAVDSEIKYPRISVSYNPIFFLSDYAIEVNNNINRNTVSTGINIINFNPSVGESLYDRVDLFTGHEFKLGVIPFNWLEFGIGYSRFISNVELSLNTQASKDYYLEGYGTFTAHENFKFSYEPAYNSYLGYIKLNIPIYENQPDNEWKQFSLNINPQYGFSVIKLADKYSQYGIASPVFPESYTIYGNYPVDPTISDWKLIKELEPGDEILSSNTNIFSLGVSLQCLRYISIYVDFSYYASFKQDKLYIDEYFFQEGSSTGTHIRFPGTITNSMALKTGISIQIPLKL